MSSRNHLQKWLYVIVWFAVSLSQSLVALSQSKVAQRKLPPAIAAAIKRLYVKENAPAGERGPRVDEFDLNSDGHAEYFVQGFCSATGNCASWILQDREGGVRELLATDMNQVTCVRFTKSHGYRDVEISSHGSAFDSQVRVFRYNGKKYVETESFELSYEYDDKTGKSRQIKGPTNRPKCQTLFRKGAPPVNLKDQ